jgi:hypothetical protein
MTVETSILWLQGRLRKHFDDDVLRTMRFGSSTRGTMLPRTVDEDSDIDLMVVFKDGSYSPQTYLNWLKKFVEFYYQASEIYQSSPSIVLDLNHIKFDIVPATQSPLYGIQIPAPSSAFTTWMYTSPDDFKKQFEWRNIQSDGRLKRLVRLIKTWNVHAGKVYPSFELEKRLMDSADFGFDRSLKSGFYNAIQRLDVSWNEAKWRQDELARAKGIVSEAIELERRFRIQDAETLIQELIP